MRRILRSANDRARRWGRAGAASFTRPPLIATGPVASRTGGLFWITGGCLALGLSLVDQPAGAHPAAQRVLAATALVAGAAVVITGHRSPRWVDHLFNLVGTALVALLVALAGGGEVSAAYAVLFVIVPLDSFFFFGWLAAGVYLGWGLLALSCTVIVAHAVTAELAVALAVIDLVTAAVVGILVRAAAAGEVDTVTGLANWRGLQRRLAAGLPRTVSGHDADAFCAALLEVNGLRELDESLGHAAADRFLRSVVDTWTPRLPRRAVLARHGFDVLALLLPGLTVDQAVTAVEELARTLPSGQTVTAGVAGFRVGDTASLLLARADAARQQARHVGWGRVQVADDGDVREAELRAALDRQELSVVFQPIVDLETRRTVGAEALVRWEHPTRGMINPADFVPLAEAGGLIHRLGEQVLRKACAEAVDWPPAGSGKRLSVSVNVSGQELARPDYVDQVVGILTSSGLPSSCLVLEVTESSLAADGAVALESLRRLRGLGIKVAVDDFGTGYSSLARLERLPADTLKIDRAFISAMRPDRSAPVVTAIVALASALDLNLVAEGVENDSQAEALRRMGCGHGQGWLFGRPGPSHVIAAPAVPADVPAPRRARPSLGSCSPDGVSLLTADRPSGPAG